MAYRSVIPCKGSVACVPVSCSEGAVAFHSSKLTLFIKTVNLIVLHCSLMHPNSYKMYCNESLTRMLRYI